MVLKLNKTVWAELKVVISGGGINNFKQRRCDVNILMPNESRSLVGKNCNVQRTLLLIPCAFVLKNKSHFFY